MVYAWEEWGQLRSKRYICPYFFWVESQSWHLLFSGYYHILTGRGDGFRLNGEQRDIPTSKLGCTKIYNAKDIVEAGRIVELLKEHGIAAFSQEAGASVSMHGASGFGMYGIDVLVETDEVKRALQIIEAADDSQGSEKF